MSLQPARPAGIDGVGHPGPFPVGAYARRLQGWLRERARVQLFGEVVNVREARAKVFFELRDGAGAVPCSMWRDAYDTCGVVLRDGARVVAAGGPDFYPGARTASPSFSFAVTALRPAGEGDLLAQVAELRRALDAEGLLAPQKALPRPVLPRTIGVVTGEGGKARDDVLAGLRRRGWGGRLVWAFAPVQDRHAAPAITRALQDLAACPEVEVVVVARGGGSLADLLCFCDEGLCRTVALLRVPVIASVGHHTDRTLLDDVAAASCSTPTHAAEVAVPLHCGDARARAADAARRLSAHGERALRDGRAVAAAARRLDGHAARAVPARARALAHLARRPGEHVRRERERLRRDLERLEAAGAARTAREADRTARKALVLARQAEAAAGPRAAARRAGLDALAAVLAAHDPQRVVERGYALVEDRAGGVVAGAAAAREAGSLRLRFADGTIDAEVQP